MCGLTHPTVVSDFGGSLGALQVLSPGSHYIFFGLEAVPFPSRLTSGQTLLAPSSLGLLGIFPSLHPPTKSSGFSPLPLGDSRGRGAQVEAVPTPFTWASPSWPARQACHSSSPLAFGVELLPAKRQAR